MKAPFLYILGIILLAGFSLGFHYERPSDGILPDAITHEFGETPPLAWSCRTSGMTNLNISMMMSQSSVILIDWGDGSAQEAYKTTSSPYYDHFYHDYATTGGNYLIQVYGCSEDILRLSVPNDSLVELNVENLINITHLWAYDNEIDNTLDLRTSLNLEFLSVYRNEIDTLHVENLTKLNHLEAFGNNISNSIDLRGCTALYFCALRFNNIPSLNVENLPNLNTLAAYANQIDGTLDLRGCPNLYSVNVNGNVIDSLRVDGLKKLEFLYAYQNQITNAIDLHECEKVKIVRLNTNQIPSIDISTLTTLEYFHISGCGLNMASLDLESNPNLEYLDVSNISLDTLKVEGLANLETLYAINTGVENDFNLEACTALQDVQMYGSSNSFLGLQVSGLSNLEVFRVHQVGSINDSLDLSASTNLKIVEVYNNNIPWIKLGGLQSVSNISIDVSTNNMASGVLETLISDVHTYWVGSGNPVGTLIYSSNPGTITAQGNQASLITALTGGGWTVTPN